MPIPVLLNGASGAGNNIERVPMLEEAFRKAGLEADIRVSRNGAEMTQLAMRAVAEKHPVIVAAGGDGTVSTVAGMVARSESALGVLPMGTLNHFAKDLGVALDLDEAVRTIAAGHLAPVDVGEVNGRIFVNNSSLGLYPALVIHRENQRRRLGRSKWHALFWASITVLRRHPMLDVKLCLEDAVEKRRTPLVFIGNNDYKVEGFDIGRRERIDQGRLGIYLIRRRGRHGLMGLAVRALFGRLRPARDFEALEAQTIGIETRHRTLPVATDGEVTVMEMPLEYKIHPRALRVIVPAAAAGAPATT
jgi:diacylglycerol kinase family enzyme